MGKEIYENPLCARYASKEMQHIFSPDCKFSTWRKLWTALAESEQELGLAITDEQLAQLRAHQELTDEDYARAADYEHKLRCNGTYQDLCGCLPGGGTDYTSRGNELLRR